jgi:oligopeptide/dipeptide ABC transporter ATP-binding protein
MGDRGQRLTAIGGQPPDLAQLGRGCAFAQRCPQAIDRCREEAPPALSPGAGRMARCWLVNGVMAERAAAAGAG